MDTAERMFADILNTMRGAAPALSAGEKRNQALRNLRACFNKASKDGDSRIPSYLSAAILGATALIQEVAPPAPKADWERDQQGTYDRSPYGGRLEPGS